MKMESLVGVKSAFAISALLHGALVAGGMLLSIDGANPVPAEKTIVVEIVTGESRRPTADVKEPRPENSVAVASVTKLVKIAEIAATQDVSIDMPDPAILPPSSLKPKDMAETIAVKPPNKMEIIVAEITASKVSKPLKVLTENLLLSPPKPRNRPKNLTTNVSKTVSKPATVLKTDVLPKVNIGAVKQPNSKQVALRQSTGSIAKAQRVAKSSIQEASLIDDDGPIWSPANGNQKPKYPGLARRRGLEGRVVLMVLVNEDGRVVRSEMKRSSGHSILDNAAKKAVKTWRFVASQQSMKITQMTVEVPIVFQLTK